jgi:hypothetical protein
MTFRICDLTHLGFNYGPEKQMAAATFVLTHSAWVRVQFENHDHYLCISFAAPE